MKLIDELIYSILGTIQYSVLLGSYIGILVCHIPCQYRFCTRGVQIFGHYNNISHTPGLRFSNKHMWGDEIITKTLKHIFWNHVCVTQPGEEDFVIKTHKKPKVTVRILPTLRMVMSWKLGDQQVIDMNDGEILNYLVEYIKTNYYDMYIFKQFEEYCF